MVQILGGFGLGSIGFYVFLAGFPQVRRSPHRFEPYQTPVIHPFFVPAVVRVCLSTHTLGIIASKSGFSITVPRAESREDESRTKVNNQSFGASPDHRWEIGRASCRGR